MRLDFNEIMEVLGFIINIPGAIVAIRQMVRKKDAESSGKPIKRLDKRLVVVFVVIFIFSIVINIFTIVPNVEGKLYSDAKNILNEYRLDYNTEQGKENCKVENQTPGARGVVLKGTIIKLELECIPEPTITPTVADTPTPTSTNTPTPIATNTPTPIPQYKVTFDSNGGSIVAAHTATYGETLTDFPEPTREYFRFLGWTYNGQKVTSINVEHDMILVATWEEKEVSDWVLESYVPSGAQIIDEKWTYTKKEITESTNPSLSGWILTGSHKETVASGTFEYADFPDTFDTSSPIYTKIYGSKDEVSITNGAEREIVSDEWAGYVYWHYAYPLKEQGDAGDRIVSKTYHYYLEGLGYTDIFNAFRSDKEYTVSAVNKAGDGTVYKITDMMTSYAESGGSYWWFRFSYYTCTYCDVKTEYEYTRTSELESNTEPSGDGVSNVVKWVRYREK